uniref:Ferritin n=1 Tax=Kalanchoe fedtschenkoi TaxID=63787 RepID=A0A7N0ZXY2_KALFE
MLLKDAPAFALLKRAGNGLNPFSSCSTSAATARESDRSRPLSGVVFEPFDEVKKELSLVPTIDSLAGQKYSAEFEVAVNEQINVEHNVSHVYHAMNSYFDRDNVALKKEEREHAEKFMEYQNKRGGKVKLQSILTHHVFEFDNVEKGDALYAMELALSPKKLTNEKLFNLHRVATENNDVQLSHFVESEFLIGQGLAR